MPTMPVLCLLCLYYAYFACTLPTMPTVPVLCLLCLYYAYYACTMPTLPVLCLLCLYYAYYACTMPTMPVLCLLCLFITTAILHALCWSRRHQQFCHFSSLLLLSDSRSVLASLSSPPSFLLSQTLWQIWQELSSLFYQTTMGPRTLVSPGKRRW